MLQINTTVNTGSTGRIAEGIGKVMIAQGYESYIAYGRGTRPSASQLIKIGTQQDICAHGLKSLLLDRHGFGSKKATQALVQQIQAIQPDVIGLHNLHGYYVNVKVLFQALERWKIPVVWTLFDCWAFTGHCTYYDNVNCQKWQSECHACPKTRYYPQSLGLDQSRKSYRDKKYLFHLPENLHLVVHSKWLERQVAQSFLRDLPIHHIYNGTDLSVFKPSAPKQKTPKVVLGVANIWNERKGLKDMIALSQQLPKGFQVVCIGLSKKQIRSLPANMIGIQRTDNVQELAEWYSKATVFVNPTYQDNFPTTNIEALACGTPVVTYNTGGSPEAINDNTGRVVEQGSINGLVAAIEELASKDQQALSKTCLQRAEQHFNQENRYKEYVELYESLVAQNQSTSY